MHVLSDSEVDRTRVRRAKAPRDVRLRKTEFRAAVRAIFEASGAVPLTAKEVVDRLLLERQMQVFPSLVYRYARDLEFEGLLWRQLSEDGVMCWHMPPRNTGSTCRVVCSRCKLDLSIDNPRLRMSLEHAANECGIALGDGALTLMIDPLPKEGHCDHVRVAPTPTRN